MTDEIGADVWELLGAYEAADHDYYRWCALLKLNPLSHNVEAAYDLVHTGYASLWLHLGDTFHERLWPIASRWRARQGRLGLAIRDSLRAK